MDEDVLPCFQAFDPDYSHQTSSDKSIIEIVSVEGDDFEYEYYLRAHKPGTTVITYTDDVDDTE